MSATDTWVLLRGLTRESRHWGDFPDRLQEALPGSRVVTLDLPGSGLLNEVRSPWRVDAIARHCRGQLAQRHIAPPYNLFAMSLGGMVGLAWAASAPAEIARCVLINTSARGLNPFHQRLRPNAYLAIASLLLLGARGRGSEELILRLTSSRPEATRQVLADWIAYREDRPVSRRNALRQLLAAATYRAPLHPLAVPVLLLAGANDRLVDPRCSATLARAWDCELALHPAAGHDLPLDDAEWVVRRVRTWLHTPLPGPTISSYMAPSTDLNRAATGP
jgi:pimeloyl-ACP methyl ester carboxylesterase